MATIDIGQKEGAAVPLSQGGGAGLPSNTMWPGPRSTYVPNSVFIHPAVWPQYTGGKNWVAVVPFFLEEAGSPLNIKSSGPRLPPYQVAS